MGIRPAKCYRKIERPNTRQSKRKPRRSYVKGVPHPKIVKFVVGNKAKKEEFPLRGSLIAKQAVQIRHNALEAVRIGLNKALEKGCGKDMYYFRVHVFPHHVMRENPLATGAGADRFQTGMRKAFGKPIGLAAQVRAGQRLIEVRANKGKEAAVKKALKQAACKLPTTCRIAFEHA